MRYAIVVLLHTMDIFGLCSFYQVCAVCLDGTVYEENEIVFCEKCNMPVHQYCYGIDKVPDGEWCVPHLNCALLDFLISYIFFKGFAKLVLLD